MPSSSSANLSVHETHDLCYGESSAGQGDEADHHDGMFLVCEADRHDGKCYLLDIQPHLSFGD